jgi:cytoskeleton protein RodZ
MPESLGEKLRQAREERGISISEVSEQTRISSLYLESIENDDYRPLPGGIFNKGFVKSFARYVGIDEQEALQDYTRLISSQNAGEDAEENKTYRPQVLTDDSSGPSMIPTVIFAIIILGLMTWGVVTLVNWWQNPESSAVSNENTVDANVNAVKNANTNANSGSADEPLPAMNDIKVSMTTSAEALSVTATIDGQSEVRTLNAGNKEITFEAEKSIKLSYYEGNANTVGLTVNGRKIETPVPPPDYRKNAFEYEINMSNLKETLTNGKIPSGQTSAAEANTNTAAKPTP